MRSRQKTAALVGLASWCVTLGIFAEKRPLSALVMEHAFDTAEAAVYAALLIAIERSRRHEYGGAIFLSGGRYYYTEPVTNRFLRGAAYDAEAPPDAVLVGVYHTHPPDDMDEYFSAEDVLTATRLGVKSYLGVVSKRRIRVFDPARMRATFIWKKENFGRMSAGVLLTASPPP